MRRRTLLGAGAAGLLGALAGCATADTPAGPDPGTPAGTSPDSGAADPGPGTGPGPASHGSEEGKPSGGPAAELVHAGSGRPEVALTFHGAGDPALAGRVLTTLADADAAVTVLAVGTWLQAHPDVARTVTGLGHELGNHTWSHRTMSALSAADQRAEIERCRDRIAALTGGPGAFFRQSAARRATPLQLRLAGAAGYSRVLSYDVDSLDYTDPAPGTVRRRVAAAAAGSVVSLHLGHPVTLAALPGILTDLRDRGLRPVTATRLFTA